MEAPTATLIAVLTLGAALVLLAWAVYRRFPVGCDKLCLHLRTLPAPQKRDLAAERR